MRFDGNAVAGALAEIFGRDMTLASATCAGCGDRAMLGEAAAYVTAMGAVLRCRGCDETLAVVVAVGERMRFSMGGIRSLELGGIRTA